MFEEYGVSEYLIAPHGEAGKLVAHLNQLLEGKEEGTNTLLENAKAYKLQSQRMWDNVSQKLA